MYVMLCMPVGRDVLTRFDRGSWLDIELFEMDLNDVRVFAFDQQVNRLNNKSTYLSIYLSMRVLLIYYYLCE